jgi:hypothetical protein
MKTILAAVAVAFSLAAPASAETGAGKNRAIVGLAAEQVRWFTPSYYTDGRQRARLFGDSSRVGAWVDRVRLPAGMRIRAHTHPHDELVTVIEGTWYLGAGERFDTLKLKGYPGGSFIGVPAGFANFAAAKDGDVVVQLNGTEKFGTDYLEK